MSDGYAGGLELAFFESVDFEKPDADSPENPEMAGRNLLRLLMMGWRDDWKDLVSWDVFKAVFSERNHSLTKGLRLAFQQGFTHIYSQLQNKELTTLQHKQAELYLANCLTLLPYADITPYESFAIPQWVNGSWQLVEYKVVPIELTPTSGFTKLFLNNDDRVFAYGLEPINNPDASPHLIFMGTTYPAGQGFHTQVNTDLESFETVGKKLYRSGHANISNWLDKQTKKVRVCGTSLGGSLSLLLAIDQGEKLSRVDALNPAGLYNSWRKSSFDHWDEQTDKPEVFVQKQGNDPVSIFGVWKPDWTILKVTPPANKQGPNAVTDHALNYAGFADTTFTEVDAQADNEERKHRDLWLYTVARSIFYYLVLVPFRYVILPTWRYVFNHKLQLFLTAALFTLFFLVPALATGFVIPMVGAAALAVLNAIFPALLGAYWLNNIIMYASDSFTGKCESDISKFIAWFSTQSTIAQALILTAPVLVLSAALVVAICFPGFAPLIMSGLVLAPMIVKGITKIISWIEIITGYNKVAKPDCQDPELPRNETMNIYKNTTTANFTFKELGDYYRAKRCLLKNKDFLPASKEVGKEKFNGFSKYEVLEKSEDEVTNNATLPVEASKAKIHDMKQIVQLVNRYGLNRDSSDMMQKLKDLDSEYTAGKVKPCAPGLA